MTHTLSAKEQSLSKIFSDDYVFTIPGYQRPYSWGTEQAQELLEDLLGALESAPSTVLEAAPYFLGSIVLIKSETSPEAIVVDGQQRLTTLTLLLSSIRAAVVDAKVQTSITNRIYEHGDVVSATQARYRLSLRERDQDFFRSHVQHEGGLSTLLTLNTLLPSSQARLQGNAQVFMTCLSKLSQSDLVRLAQFIVTRCFLVSVATPDLDSAYRIFGVLNSRGLDLSASDILKAEIIGGIKPALRDAYTKKWEDEEEDLGREAFGDLVGHIRMIYRKAKPKGTLLKEFKEHVMPTSEAQDLVDKTILPMAQAFGELRAAEYSSQWHAEQVNEHLRWLNRLEFNDWVPPALAFFVRHKQQPEAVLSFFRDLERLGYSMLIRRSGTNDRIERFAALTAAVEANRDLAFSTSPLQLSPTEQQQTYVALAGPLYESHSSRALALLLLRLDRLIADGSAVYRHDVVSVEHVMPQQPAPNSQWASWVPDSAIHQRWVHRIGNLTLLSRKKNSSASNRDFAWKKSAYFTKGGVTAFALTTQVLQHDKWTVDVMQQRQDSMLQALEQHWRLENRQTKVDIADSLLAQLTQEDDGVQFELESARRGLAATAMEKDGTFYVLAGSQVKLEWLGEPHAYQQLRDTLRESGALRLAEDGTHLLFHSDTVFKSPSAASATILGRTDNGRNTWRVKGTSITYGAWKDNQPR